MAEKKVYGTHAGVKKGKTFASPGNPNKKAQRKLEARLKYWETTKDKVTHEQHKPGSAKKAFPH